MNHLLVAVLLFLFPLSTFSSVLLEKMQRLQKRPMYASLKPASFLDETLWDQTTIEQLVYNATGKRFVTNKINVLKFKYNDNQAKDILAANAMRNPRSSQRRRKREVFGKDQRLQITQKYVEEYPFSSVVRLSNGCSGTIIWNQHVLTSAHCVHNQTHLTTSVEKLKIGFLNQDGSFTWHSVQKVFVPPQWTKQKNNAYLTHDFAVIKLSKQHKRRWMPFGTQNLEKNNLIQFVGFPSDKKKNEMWFSYCSVSQRMKHLFVNHCDAAPGMSGSGVYVYNKNVKGRKLIAVFSSYVQYTTDKRSSRIYEANIATRLTPKKVKRICKWLDAGTNCYRIRPQ